ncbi:uncharacterized mitochondrial protein-like protein [Tanacetum coccineum]|uniref:Uncharacterized mitochondrial protein-like protein n=1 Tax=Tanacetum coccineum TaxID=301880 RepID=A0ABQ5F8A5_9ASTR
MQDTTHERLQRKRIHEQKRDKKTQKKRRPPAGEKQIEREQRRKSKTGRKKKKQNTRTARESVEEAADAEKRDRRRNHKNREAHEKKKTKVRQERRRIEEKRREEKKQEYEKKRRGSKTKGKDTETKQVSTSYGENSKEVEKRRRRNRAERTQKTSQKQKETRKQARDTRQRPTHPRRKESRHANDTTEGDKARKEEEPRNKESKKRTKKEREHINEKDQESKRDTHGAKPPKTATQRIRSRAETANTRRRKQNTLNTEKRERQRRRREKKRKKKEEKKESFKTQEEGEVQKKTQPERRHRKRGGGMKKEYKDEGEDFLGEFPAIVFDNTSYTTPPCEPTVSPPNESELDFRISCYESDDEDYTVLFNENSFSYKIVSVKDLKTVSENNDNNVALSPNPTIDYELDYFNDFENEFPIFVYNDGLTSNSKPVNAESTDEFNLTDETSLSEYEEEVISRFNDLFNEIQSADSKSEIDDDDNNIGIVQSSEDMAPLPAIDQRHPWLRYKVEGYTPNIVHSYEQRLETIWSRPVNRVYTLDFAGLTPEMSHNLAVRLRMVYTGEQGQLFVSHAWRRLFEIRGPLVREFILEFLSTFRMGDTVMDLDTFDTLCFQLGEGGFGAYWIGSDRLIPDKGDLRDYWLQISSDRDFLGPVPSFVLIRDPVRRLCHRMIAYSISVRGQAHEKVTGVDLFYLRSIDHRTINIPHLLVQYLFRHAEGRKSGARLSGGHFIGRLDMHFGLVSDEGLRGLQVVARELPLIDLHELGRLNIYTRYDNTWAWVAQGPERQQAAAVGTPEAGEDAQGAEEVALEILAPAPAQAPPPAPQPRTMSQRIERLEGEVYDLRRDVVGLRGDVARFTIDQTRVSTWLSPA